MQSDIIAPPKANEEPTQPPPQQPVQAPPVSQTPPTVGNDMAPPNGDLHLGVGLRSPKENPATPPQPSKVANDNQAPQQTAENIEQPEDQQHPQKKKSRRLPMLVIVIAILIFLSLAGLAIYRELGTEEATLLINNLV